MMDNQDNQNKRGMQVESMIRRSNGRIVSEVMYEVGGSRMTISKDGITAELE